MEQFYVEAIGEVLNSNTVAVIAGAILAGIFGFGQYRAQKRWENIDERYFKNGLEKLISYLQSIRTKIEHNHNYALVVLRYFRGLDKGKFYDWLEGSRSFKSVGSISAKMPNSFFITEGILNDKRFSKLCINIFAQIGAINDFYVSDLMMSIEKIHESGRDKEEAYQKLWEEATKRYSEVVDDLGLYKIIDILEETLKILKEKNINSYKKLKNVYLDNDIKRELGKLKDIKI